MCHPWENRCSKKVWATGDIVLRAELDLLIRNDNGVLRPETFRVDSGTEITSMAAARAKALDLPMPRNAIFLDIDGQKPTPACDHQFSSASSTPKDAVVDQIKA